MYKVLNVMCVYSDLYEGTRMAKVGDFSAIRQIIQPLEDSGTLVKRTDEEVCSQYFSPTISSSCSISTYISS